MAAKRAVGIGGEGGGDGLHPRLRVAPHVGGADLVQQPRGIGGRLERIGIIADQDLRPQHRRQVGDPRASGWPPRHSAADRD